jgi:3-oxoadipate enol-lactonase
MMAAKSSGYAEVNGARLYYEIEGEGQPLVLIHSALMNSKMWDDQVAAFSPHYRVIRFDMRGFGKSSWPDTDALYHDDIALLLKSLGVQKAAILGLSLGAEIALDFTLKYPQMVSALILASSGLDGFDYPETVMRRWNAFIEPVKRRDFPAAIDRYMADWVDGPTKSASLAVRQKVRAIMDEYTFAHYLPREKSSKAAEDMVSDIPQMDRLEEIKVPTLIIVGDRDQPDIVEIGEVLEDSIEGAKRVEIEHAGHMVNFERPREFNQAVLDFLSHVF